ncbi:MAG TPA: M20 family metallopeptidase [Ktedonobacteraceae bacterium]|jgi:glutamate carboxypeptidase|nr:M20 family metallopeptidase [Ktedonobacteraceae bacterium]
MYAQCYLPIIQTYQSELLERLQLLINIDSGTGQVEGVNKIITLLEQWAGAIGYTTRQYPTDNFGNNLVIRREGRGKLRLLLVGHIDTVYPAGAAQRRPFYISEGLAYGPGVIDMKSGALMGLYTLKALQEVGFEEYGTLTMVFNNDEEVGSPGSSPLLRELAREADIGLVLEPSRSLEFITKARKGADKYILEITGIPAHSGAEPHKGRSAVIELAHKMIAVHHLNSMFPGITFNITRISSSELLNVVPDSARCHISVRAFDERSLNLAFNALEQIAAGHSIPDTHSRLIRTRGRQPYVATPHILRLVEAAQQEGSDLGIAVVGEGKGGLSDANLLVEAGVPTLDSLGPIGGGMHDLNREFLRIDSLPTRGAMLAGLIHRLCLSESTGENRSLDQ